MSQQPPPSERQPSPGSLDADQTERTREGASTPYRARLLSIDRAGQGVTGRRSTAVTTVGRHLRAVPLDHPQGSGISVTGTLLAAVSDRLPRRVSHFPLETSEGECGNHKGPWEFDGSHLRRSLREGKEGNLVVFVVDTSGSMGAARRVREVKTAVVSLLLDAYQRRDRVAVVTFGGADATTALPPTSSVERAERMLADVPTGGRTPLAEALTTAYGVVRREQVRDPQRRALVVLVTDGRATAGPGALDRARRAADAAGATGTACVVVDAEDPRSVVRLGLARELAARLGAEHLPLADVAADRLRAIVRERGVA